MCCRRRSGRLPVRQPGPGPPGTPAPQPTLFDERDGFCHQCLLTDTPAGQRPSSTPATAPTPASKTASAAAKTPDGAASPAASSASTPAGAVPTPADPLELMEVPELRWLHARRRPAQSVKSHSTTRSPGSTTSGTRQAARSPTGPRQRPTPTRTTGPSRARPARLPVTPHPAPFRTPASIVDLTTATSSSCCGSRAASTPPAGPIRQPHPDALRQPTRRDHDHVRDTGA